WVFPKFSPTFPHAATLGGVYIIDIHPPTVAAAHIFFEAGCVLFFFACIIKANSKNRNLYWRKEKRTKTQAGRCNTKKYHANYRAGGKGSADWWWQYVRWCKKGAGGI